MKKFLALSLCVASVGSVQAGLIQTQVDSDINNSSVVLDNNASSGEYATNFSNGSGSGFGGTLGSGTIRMDADSGMIYFGLTPGASLDNPVVIYLDTKSGGFDDSTMNDTSDGGRSAVTNLTRDANDAFPTGFLADYAVVIAGFGALSFELTGGSLNYMNNYVNSKEIGVSRADLGLTGSSIGFNWFAAYCSESMYNSDESMPSNPQSGTGNPGFGPNGFNYENYNRFEAVPEPASIIAVSAGILALIRKKRVIL